MNEYMMRAISFFILGGMFIGFGIALIIMSVI